MHGVVKMLRVRVFEGPELLLVFSRQMHPFIFIVNSHRLEHVFFEAVTVGNVWIRTYRGLGDADIALT